MSSKKNMPVAPVVCHVANLWSLWDHPSTAKEWSLERKIAAVKEAGFDGFTTAAEEETILGSLKKYNLRVVGLFFVRQSKGIPHPHPAKY